MCSRSTCGGSSSRVVSSSVSSRPSVAVSSGGTSGSGVGSGRLERNFSASASSAPSSSSSSVGISRNDVTTASRSIPSRSATHSLLSMTASKALILETIISLA